MIAKLTRTTWLTRFYGGYNYIILYIVYGFINQLMTGGAHVLGVGVLIEHHPTIWDILPNRHLKVIFRIPKRTHLPRPPMIIMGKIHVTMICVNRNDLECFPTWIQDNCNKAEKGVGSPPKSGPWDSSSWLPFL